MKSILHLKEDTEYQIPLRETETETETEKDDKGADRAKVDVATANPKVEAKKETKADVKDQRNLETHKEKAAATQSQDDSTAKKKTDEISQEDVNDKEEATATQSQDDVDALETVEEDPDETQNQEPSNTEENSNNDITTDGVPPADTAKAALDEMKKLASQGGVIHPSLFISNFSKILGLMERAMQLQVKESGSVSKEEASKANEQAEVPEQTEVPEQAEMPAEGKQGELNDNTNNNRS